MLEIVEQDDAILIGQIDRITRLTEKDWNELKSIILNNRLKIISMDLPTSHNFADQKMNSRVGSSQLSTP